MAGISIRLKNASYYGAIKRVKTVKNTPVKLSDEKKKLLSDLKKTSEPEKRFLERSDNKEPDLKTEQIANENEQSVETVSQKGEEKVPKWGAKEKKVFVGTSVYKQNGYLDSGKTKSAKSDVKPKKKLNYRYMDVSSKIMQAKTSISAGQAVISAKRKVLELRRKAAAKNVDSEELMLALSHAKKMEMIAKKKKHNLELEEMVAHTKERDERLDKIEEASENAKNAQMDVAKQTVEEAQDSIQQQQDAYAEELYEEAQKMLESFEEDSFSEEELQNVTEAVSDEMMQMIESFGQDEMEMLEETMEMLEQLETVNPHMSDRQFENLKRKHRASENKAIAKANMEYFKGVMKQLEKETHHASSGLSAQSVTYSPVVSAEQTVSVAVPGGISVDVSL